MREAEWLQSTHLVVLVVKQPAAPQTEIHPAVVTALDRGRRCSDIIGRPPTHPYECLRDSSLALAGLFVGEVRVPAPRCCQSAHLKLPGFPRLSGEEDQSEGDRENGCELLQTNVLLREKVLIHLLGGPGGGQHLPVYRDARQILHGNLASGSNTKSPACAIYVFHLLRPRVHELVLLLSDGQRHHFISPLS